jgi:predicted HTH transcriptional regulator
MYTTSYINMQIKCNTNSNVYKYIILNIIMKIPSAKILKLIEKEKVVTSSEVAEAFGVSWNTAEKYLVELIIEGKVERIKKVGVNLWLLK